MSNINTIAIERRLPAGYRSIAIGNRRRLPGYRRVTMVVTGSNPSRINEINRLMGVGYPVTAVTGVFGYRERSGHTHG